MLKQQLRDRGTIEVAHLSNLKVPHEHRVAVVGANRYGLRAAAAEACGDDTAVTFAMVNLANLPARPARVPEQSLRIGAHLPAQSEVARRGHGKAGDVVVMPGEVRLRV